MSEANRQEEMRLRKNYMGTFNPGPGQEVLKDLGNRCFKYDTTFAGDPSAALVNEGARQVLVYIENMMSPEGMERLIKGSEKESKP